MASRQLGSEEPQNQRGVTAVMSRVGTLPQLWKRVGELQSSSTFLIYVAKVGSDRMTLTQAAFFLLAATADARGTPATRSQLLEDQADLFRGSIRNSYRQLLEPTRAYPTALGWLSTEPNPNDDREQFLRLTDEGRSIIIGALMALEPINEVTRRAVNPN